ncbi:MAG: Na/Pi cotransporter family protein [Chitinophagaceae bacterium]|nr:Na/Pi cotransporter family protein [Chitinophagaceae bacterium]
MLSWLDIGKMLAGVAIFLVGMNFMEDSLRSLAGRNFKLFLKKQTSNTVKAIGGGTVVTALLQSSSITNLLTLSMVGAGVIKMKNALAVMLGSNLGSTVFSWIVALIGFSFHIESFALPLAGISGICLTFFSNSRRWYQWCRLFLGFSFLFVGLGFIKEGMQEVVAQTDLSQFNHYPVIVFFLAGLVLTAIVQTSSATMALTLSAVYTHAISLYAATAIVLGSEIGTIVKLFIASANGSPVKKRVALGNFLFNTITVALLLLLLQPVNWLITDALRIHDQLIALVFFQTLVNITSIILFYPLLNTMSRFLEKRFVADDEESLFIHKVNLADTELALEGLEKESLHFMYHVLSFSTEALGTGNKIPEEFVHKNFSRKTVMEKYEYIKHLHGEIHGFGIGLQDKSTIKPQTERIEQLISSTRNSMYAAKNIRDALQDIEQLRNSSNDTKYRFYLDTKDKLEIFCRQLTELMGHTPAAEQYEKITNLYKQIQQGYTATLQELYREGMARHVNEAEISTLINFNREMYTAFKSLVFAVKDHVLKPAEADRFDNVPGFIR